MSLPRPVMFYFITTPISHFIFVTTLHCPSRSTLNLFLLLKQGNYSFRKIVLCKHKHTEQWTLKGRNKYDCFYIGVGDETGLGWSLTPLPVIISQHWLQSIYDKYLDPAHEWFSTSSPSNLHLFFTINWRPDSAIYNRPHNWTWIH